MVNQWFKHIEFNTPATWIQRLNDSVFNTNTTGTQNVAMGFNR